MAFCFPALIRLSRLLFHIWEEPIKIREAPVLYLTVAVRERLKPFNHYKLVDKSVFYLCSI